MATTRERFVTDRPLSTTAEVMAGIREKFAELAEFIEFNTPPSRERSLAITKLEESKYWTNQGLIVSDNDYQRKISEGEDE